MYQPYYLNNIFQNQSQQRPRPIYTLQDLFSQSQFNSGYDSFNGSSSWGAPSGYNSFGSTGNGTKEASGYNFGFNPHGLASGLMGLFGGIPGMIAGAAYNNHFTGSPISNSLFGLTMSQKSQDEIDMVNQGIIDSGGTVAYGGGYQNGGVSVSGPSGFSSNQSGQPGGYSQAADSNAANYGGSLGNTTSGGYDGSDIGGLW